LKCKNKDKESKMNKRRKKRNAPQTLVVRAVPPVYRSKEWAQPSWAERQGNCVWLENDPRSVAAMLRGKGDGREKLYERFEKYWRKKNPAGSELCLHEAYAKYADHMERRLTREASSRIYTPRNIPRFLARINKLVDAYVFQLGVCAALSFWLALKTT
jgi:hypothetical protein